MEVQRPTRQENGYDCGVFVFADLASLMMYGVASQASQVDIKGLRKDMWNGVCELQVTGRRLRAEEFLQVDREFILV